jgi:hypothetical protein
MRCSAWSSLAISACSALVFAATAEAHVVSMPSYVRAGETSSILLSVPNERPKPMRGVTITVPRGFRIVGARPVAEWTADVQGRTATWSGGALPVAVTAHLALELEAPEKPGVVTLLAKESYADGAVRWPVSLTIVPGAQASQNLGAALVAGILGLLAITGLALLLGRRRGRGAQARG